MMSIKLGFCIILRASVRHDEEGLQPGLFPAERVEEGKGGDGLHSARLQHAEGDKHTRCGRSPSLPGPLGRQTERSSQKKRIGQARTSIKQPT